MDSVSARISYKQGFFLCRVSYSIFAFTLCNVKPDIISPSSNATVLVQIQNLIFRMLLNRFILTRVCPIQFKGIVTDFNSFADLQAVKMFAECLSLLYLSLEA